MLILLNFSQHKSRSDLGVLICEKLKVDSLLGPPCTPEDIPLRVVAYSQELGLVPVSKKIRRVVGRLGSEVRVSASFQIFSRGNIRGGGISPRGYLIPENDDVIGDVLRKET